MRTAQTVLPHRTNSLGSAYGYFWIFWCVDARIPWCMSVCLCLRVYMFIGVRGCVHVRANARVFVRAYACAYTSMCILSAKMWVHVNLRTVAHM